MLRAGFVLVGGKSSRMGRDKALLPWAGATLAEHVAGTVARVVPGVALIGSPELYGRLGYEVHADLFPNCGPIGGIATALKVSPAEWNLIVACDMPQISEAQLEMLLAAAERSDGDCVVPVSDSGPEPVCAVYHQRCLPALEDAIAARRFRMRDVVNELRADRIAVADSDFARNVNTPEDLQVFPRR